MKALVLLELHFFKDKYGEYWCNRVIDYKYLKRYLDVFEEITICARISKIENADSLLKASGPRVNFIALPETQGLKSTMLKSVKVSSIFKKVVKEHDVIILRVPSLLTFLLYHDIKKSGLPFSMDLALSGRNMLPGGGIVKRIVNNQIDRYLKKICMEANGVSYVTEHILQDEYPCRAMMEPNNSKYFTNFFSSIELYDEHYYQQNWDINKQPEEFIVTHSGYMDDGRKCQDVLLRAVSIVIKQGYKIKVKFIGDGALREDYEELARELGIYENCMFCGLIRNKQEVFNQLRSSHLFVLPTKAEGLPRAVLEAMAQGLPCISSPVDGVPELLPPEDMVNWWDAEGYAKKIIEFITDWPEMIARGQKNHTKALGYHNVILQKRRYEFYHKLRKLAENHG